MMNDIPEHLLKDLIKQWNIAERRIKKAEQVRANQVVASAIFELRYAGRKIMDAFDLALTNDLSKNEEAAKKVHAYIVDAIEDCVKSKHDAIDAMMNFVTNWFEVIEKSIGLTKIQTLFPNYLEYSSNISDIQDKIEESRGNRVIGRDSIYDDIEKTGYDDILKLYKTMNMSLGRVQAEADRERLWKNIQWIVAVAGTIFGILGFLVGIAGILYAIYAGA